MTYDDFIEFYQIERALAKEQVTSWQERLGAVEDALEKMIEARRKQRLRMRPADLPKASAKSAPCGQGVLKMVTVEIDVELLSDLVDAAGWVGNFFTDLQSGHTPEYHPDWGAAQYLASEAVLIEQRGRAVLEAVEQNAHADGACPSG